MPQTEQTMRLLANGWLPGWAGLLLAAGLMAFVFWQLQLEFRRVRPSTLTRWLLPGLRLAIVALLTWLLCRPELLLTTQWAEKPRLLLVTDKTQSLEVVENYATRHEKLDVLEQLGLATFPKRQRAAATLSRLATSALQEFDPIARACQDDLDRLGTGLPPAPELHARLETAGRHAAALSTQLDAAKAELPAESTDKALAAEIANLQQAAVQLAAPLRTLQADATLVQRNAAAHPDTLEGYTGKLTDAVAAARALLPLAHAVQDKLDAARIPAADFERALASPVTRRAIAARIVTDISTPTAATFAIERVEAHADAAGIRERGLQGNLAAVVCIGDGTAAWPDASLRELALLHSTPVHTVLVGQDGVQPQDAGIIALEIPAVVVRGRPFTLRVLAMCNLPPGKRPALTVENASAPSNTAATATVPLPETAAGEIVLSVPLTLEQPGRTHLHVSLGSSQADAFPGNETADAYVSVWPEAPRILLASGQLNSDTAAWLGVLTPLAPETLDVLVYEPGLRELALGNEPGTFPATAENWKRVDLAVLTGPIPTGLPAAALAGLKDAVRNGLRVLVQDTVPAGGTAVTWASTLGLTPTPRPSPAKLGTSRDRPFVWIEDVSRLGVDMAASTANLAALPATPYAFCKGNATLLQAGADPVVAATLRPDMGFILYGGIRRFDALRTGNNAATVNRLMTGLATYALRLPDTREGKPHVNDPHPRERADFALTPQAANLAAIAQAAGGQPFAFSDGAQKIVDALPKAQPVWREHARLVPLWSGAWPLLLLLVLVSAEYLLRRRAGRVM